MRIIVLLTLAVAGCFSLPDDGALLCDADPAHRCPAGYHCAGDGRCYHDGHDPDLATSGDADLSDPSMSDMGSDDLPAAVCGASGQPCCASAPACSSGYACFNGTCTNADVWSVGGGANVVLVDHWNGTTWSSMTLTTPVGLLTPIIHRLWGAASDDIWAVGWAEPQGPPSDQPPVPAVYRWNGTAWTFCKTSDACAVPSSTIIMSIFGLAANDIWVVANDGAYHWDGATWTKKSTGMVTGPSTALSIWCAATDDCWAVGNDSSLNVLLQHWNGAAWSTPPHTAINGTLASVYGFSSTDVWAVGNSNSAAAPVIVHWNGTEWSNTFFVADSAGMSGVWGAATNDVWAVGANGRLAHWNGSGWTGVNLGNAINCDSVWGASSRDIWISAGSSMVHWDGASWTSTMPAGQSPDLRGLWGKR